MFSAAIYSQYAGAFDRTYAAWLALLLLAVTVAALVAHAVACRAVLLADAIGRRGVDGNAEFLELFRLGDDAFRPDLPLELHGDDIGLLGEHAFEARLVVGEAVDLGVDLLIACLLYTSRCV